jgi:hypothetical protein
MLCRGILSVERESIPMISLQVFFFFSLFGIWDAIVKE